MIFEQWGDKFGMAKLALQNRVGPQSKLRDSTTKKLKEPKNNYLE
jgi:hypothetical protein